MRRRTFLKTVFGTLAAIYAPGLFSKEPQIVAEVPFPHAGFPTWKNWTAQYAHISKDDMIEMMQETLNEMRMQAPLKPKTHPISTRED